MNRKGSESGEFVFLVGKIAIAAIIVVVIFYGFYRLYDAYSISAESKKAETLIDNIEGKILLLNEGESNEFPFQGVNNWYLIGWNSSESGRPDKCFLNSCICICPNLPDYDSKEESAESCQERGFCRKVDFDKVEVFTSLTYTTGVPAGGFESPFCINFKNKALNKLYIGNSVIENDFSRKEEKSTLFIFRKEHVSGVPGDEYCASPNIF